MALGIVVLGLGVSVVVAHASTHHSLPRSTLGTENGRHQRLRRGIIFRPKPVLVGSLHLPIEVLLRIGELPFPRKRLVLMLVFLCVVVRKSDGVFDDLVQLPIRLLLSNHLSLYRQIKLLQIRFI